MNAAVENIYLKTTDLEIFMDIMNWEALTGQHWHTEIKYMLWNSSKGEQSYLPSILVKVSWGFPRGVRNLYMTHNWAASDAAHDSRTKLDESAKLPNIQMALSSSGVRGDGCSGQQLQNMSCSQLLSLQTTKSCHAFIHSKDCALTAQEDSK